MRVICDICQHNVNRFSAITAHCGSSRFVTGLLSRLYQESQAYGNAWAEILSP